MELYFPALYRREKRVLLPFLLFGTAFFLAGAMFCYYVVAPKGFGFLLGEYSTEYIKAFPTIKESLSFLLSLMIGFGLVLSLPFWYLSSQEWGLLQATG